MKDFNFQFKISFAENYFSSSPPFVSSLHLSASISAAYK